MKWNEANENRLEVYLFAGDASSFSLASVESARLVSFLDRVGVGGLQQPPRGHEGWRGSNKEEK